MAVYLDTSAFVKLVVREAESRALQRFLKTRSERVASTLLQVESRRAARRTAVAAVDATEARLRQLLFIPIDARVLEAAGTLDPPGLRTLDAIHLASALSVGPDLECLVTYDARMTEAAIAVGLSVAAPS